MTNNTSVSACALKTCQRRNRVHIAIWLDVMLYSLVGVALVYHIHRLLSYQFFVSRSNLIHLQWWFEASHSSKTLEHFYQATWCHILDYSNPLSHCCGKLLLHFESYEILTAMLLRIQVLWNLTQRHFSECLNQLRQFLSGYDNNLNMRFEVVKAGPQWQHSVVCWQVTTFCRSLLLPSVGGKSGEWDRRFFWNNYNYWTTLCHITEDNNLNVTALKTSNLMN